MIDVRGIVQKALDDELSGDNVYSHWQWKAEVSGEDPDQYIVYTLSGDADNEYADNHAISKVADITIRYYYNLNLLQTSNGRDKVKATENRILQALNDNGIKTPGGAFDVGDIEDNGYGCSVIEASMWRII